jgi:hypothetical protein
MFIVQQALVGVSAAYDDALGQLAEERERASAACADALVAGVSLRAVDRSSELVEAACQEVRRAGDSGLDLGLAAQLARCRRQSIRRR